MANGLALMPEQDVLQAAWMVTLPDHESTERFARILAEELKPAGVPDTVSYLTEEELTRASKDLEEVGYDPQMFHIALTAPPAPVDYYHLSIRPS